VAWSPAGTRIIASDEDPLKVGEAVKRSGYETAEVLITSAPPPDLILLGGGGLME
jgi:hypothetical protein